MSVEVHVYKHEEDMDRDVLMSLGVVGGPLAPLSTDVSMERERELLNQTESIGIGSDRYEFPSEILHRIEGVQRVDEQFLQDLREIHESHADPSEGRYSADEVLGWFSRHKGDKVFVKGL